MGNLTSTSNPILQKLEADRMYQQKQAAKNLGLNYEIWIMNEKGDLLEKIE